MRIGANSRPAAVQELEGQIKQLNRELEYAKSRKQFDRCKQIEEETMHKEAQAETALQKWKNRVGTRSQEVRVEDVAEIVSRLTGIPVTQLTAEERDRLIHMEEHIHQRVIGQDEAIDAVCDAVRLSRAGIREGRKPVATFLFLGPTGVGKTELAKALADIVYGNEDALVRIDMSEYGEKHTVTRLIGAPPGYVGYEEGGQLTERVRRQPHTVVLFDEIEKANPEVLNLLLQLFDDGRLTDGKGRLVDFTNTIVICTSNVGAELIRENLHLGKPYDELKTQLMGLLNHYFKPEFLNRIDEIIVFHALTQEQIGEIVKLQLESLRRLAHGQGIEITFDPTLIDYLVDVCFVPEYGARELKRKIRTQVSTRLAYSMLKQEIMEGDAVTIRYDSEANHVKIDRTGGERTAQDVQLTGKSNVQRKLETGT